MTPASPSSGVEGFLESRVRSLARILEDIETDASKREHLSDEVLTAIDEEAGALRSAVRTLEAALLHDAGFHPVRQGLERTRFLKPQSTHFTRPGSS